MGQGGISTVFVLLGGCRKGFIYTRIYLYKSLCWSLWRVGLAQGLGSAFGEGSHIPGIAIPGIPSLWNAQEFRPAEDTRAVV